MKGSSTLVVVIASSLLVACGGSKKPPAATAEGESSSSEGSSEKKDKTDEKSGDAGAEADESKSKASMCTGFEIDLVNALSQSACEESDKKPTDVKPVDFKKSLEVKLMPSANKIEPGGHVDVIVQMTNKSKEPMQLEFLLDPTPRFQVETYDAKGRRADVPTAKQPPVNVDRPESPQSLARVTLVPNGFAHAKVGWDAVRMRWAPEKLKGTPPEMGFPRVPAGPLPKGKYTIKIVTPLLNATEGVEHEVSAPKVTIEVGK